MVQLPFERSTFGQTFSRSTGILLERLDLFAAIAVLMFLPYLLAQAVSLGATADSSESLAEDSNDTMEGMMSQVSLVLGLLEVTVFDVFIGIVGRASVALAVARMYLGAHPETMEVLKGGTSVFCKLFCCSFLVGLLRLLLVFAVSATVTLCWLGNEVFRFIGVMIGIAGVVALVFFQVSVTIITPVVALERKGPWESIERAWIMSDGNRCYIFCTSFCLGLAFFIVNVTIKALLHDGFFGFLLKEIPFLFSFPLTSM